MVTSRVIWPVGTGSLLHVKGRFCSFWLAHLGLPNVEAISESG